MKKEKSMLGFFYTVTTMENFEKEIKNYQELVVRDGLGGLKVDVYLPSFKLFKKCLNTYERVKLYGKRGFSNIEVYYNNDGDLILRYV